MLHIRSVGHTYRYYLDDIEEAFNGASIEEVEAIASPEGMVRVADKGVDDGGAYIDLEAVEPGNGTIMFASDGGGMMTSLRVDPGMVIVVDQANFSGWEWVGWSIVLCFVAACALNAWNGLWLWRRSWYGYEMAACIGFALFCGVQALIFAQPMLSGQARDFCDLMTLIIWMADSFVQLSMLPMGVAAVLVSLSNVALVRREGKSLGNVLGIIASLAWVAGLVALQVIAGFEGETMVTMLLSLGMSSIVSAAVAFAVSLLAGTSLCAWLAARHVPSKPRDYLIVLGCALRPDGSPTPLLAGRVDAALAYARAQEESGEPLPVFVPSGGQGSDERWAEAESMRRYLLEQGVDEAHILKEDASTNTRQNFEYSAARIAESRAKGSPSPRVAFSTTNYHVFRSYVYAHEAGLAAEGIAAPTKAYFWPNAFLREFVGLLAARPLMIAGTFVLVAVLYGVAEYVTLMGSFV